MWINEAMSNSIDENYGLNFEWISAETGIVEEIGGVDKDCIVVPSISDEQFQDNNDYIEIQVTEEEVVSDDWQVAEEEVVSDDWQVNAGGTAEDMGFVMEESTEGDVVGSIEVAEDYLRLQRSPCKMCNQRSGKKSSLPSNILEDISRCNLCGAQYKRKLDEEVISDWQVAEEEVVSDDWQVNASVEAEDMGFVMEEPVEGDVGACLEDDYLKLRPYSCTLCSHRFSKKSSLSSHMITHQLEDSLRCSICGIQYKRKYELIEHMKIHSYMPGEHVSLDQSLSSLPSFKSGKIKKKVSKKKIAKKKAKWQTHLVPLTETSFDNNKPILLINSLFDVNSGSSSSKLKFDDILIKTESTEDEDYNILDDSEDKFPIIDPTRPYVCQHCGIGFAREKALISHNMIHAGDSAFECPHCHEMFISEKLLNVHQANRHPRIKILAKKKKLKTNIKKSLEADKFKTFQCEHCDASFTRYNQLKRHQRSVHIKPEINIKEEVFDFDPDNMNEEALSHTDLPAKAELHSCNTCGEEYADLSDLHNHMKSKHKWGHFCHVCGTAYRDAKSLTKHLLTHADSAHFFPCSVCHRLFYNRGKLKKHMEVAHYGKDGYRCSECSEMFVDGAALAAHKQSRHNVGRLFPCVQCGKTFTSRSSQQIHIRVHTGEKPYGCRFCWKAFADGGTLRKHERIHTGEKPYVCPVCTKAFNQRVVLREHVRAHHSEGRGRSFECTVCRETLAQSRDLVAHLVMHSDENTAKHRLPNTSTRKYSRRKDTSSTPHTSRKSQHCIIDAPLSPCK